MDVIDLWRYFGALLLVFGLIGVAAVAARRYGLPGMVKPTRTRRLSIVEALSLSPRQRLILIRRDDVEHLIAFGPDGATIIEKNIPVPPDDAEPSA